MPKIIAFAGQKHGHWTIIEPDQRKGHALCRCVCGAAKEVRRAHLYSGASTSCGCKTRHLGGDRQRTHGATGTRLHRVHAGMLGRCNNSNNPRFHRYGGRGITVCEEWRQLTAFMEWSKSNGYAIGLTIDRIDNNGPYSPDNCRWADRFTQSINREETVRLLDGRVGFIVAEENGINGDAFRARVRLGWSVEEASTRPLRPFLDRRVPVT